MLASARQRISPGASHEHKEKPRPGFTSAHGATMLVWYEDYPSLIEARHREYAIKTWRRAWQIALIGRMNPDWRNLYDELNRYEPLRGRLVALGPGRVPLRCTPPGEAP